VIAFGCVTSDERVYRAGAAKAIEEVCGRDSLLLRRDGSSAPVAAYSELIAASAAHEDLEALVLLDQRVTHLGDDMPGRLRAVLAATEAAVVGVTTGPGMLEVEEVSGAILVLSAWATRELRCDPLTAGVADAVALDLCLQAHAHRRRVVAADWLGLDPVERWSRAPDERRAWVRAMAAVRGKWA
jgi:hypothetical protein